MVCEERKELEFTKIIYKSNFYLVWDFVKYPGIVLLTFLDINEAYVYKGKNTALMYMWMSPLSYQ